MKKLSEEAVSKFIEQLHSEEKVNATVVLKSLKSNKDFTYKIKAFNVRASRYFKIGTEVGYNEFRYTYTFSVYNNIKQNEGYLMHTEATANARWLLNKLYDKNIVSILAQVELYHTGKCIKCGRTLTDLDSIEYGMGKHCRGF